MDRLNHFAICLHKSENSMTEETTLTPFQLWKISSDKENLTGIPTHTLLVVYFLIL